MESLTPVAKQIETTPVYYTHIHSNVDIKPFRRELLNAIQGRVFVKTSPFPFETSFKIVTNTNPFSTIEFELDTLVKDMIQVCQ